jgi:uncharacterized membrane protein YbaN (DUF454 family)
MGTLGPNEYMNQPSLEYPAECTAKSEQAQPCALGSPPPSPMTSGIEDGLPRKKKEVENPLLRFVFVSAGWCALGIGAIGVVVPLLPTTPFILLAALLFSKGSPKLHRWLQNTRLAGQIIRDWEAFGVIRMRAKVLSTVMMTTLISYPLFFKEMPIAYKVLAALTMICVLAFIWTRPSTPRATKISNESVSKQL